MPFGFGLGGLGFGTTGRRSFPVLGQKRIRSTLTSPRVRAPRARRFPKAWFWITTRRAISLALTLITPAGNSTYGKSSPVKSPSPPDSRESGDSHQDACPTSFDKSISEKGANRRLELELCASCTAVGILMGVSPMKQDMLEAFGGAHLLRPNPSLASCAAWTKDDKLPP